MKTEGWQPGPDWLLEEKQCPEKPNVKCNKDIREGHNSLKEEKIYPKEHKLVILESSSRYRREVSGLFIMIVIHLMRHSWEGLNYQLCRIEDCKPACNTDV